MLELQPDDYEAWNNKGVVLKNLGRYSKAIAAYNQALQIKPDKHEAWNNKGNALSDLGRYQEAISAYDKVIQIQPDYYQAWGNKGIALRGLGRYQEAIAAYNKVIEFKPDDHLAWYKKGDLLYFLGRYQKASKAYKSAIHFKPDYSEAWYNLAKAIDRLRCYKDIDAEYQEIVALDDNPRANFYRGILSYKKGSYQKALEYFNKAEELTETPDWRIWQHRGWAIYELQGYDAAIENWNQGLRLVAARQLNPTLEKLEPGASNRQEDRGFLHWQIAKASDDYAQKQEDPKPYQGIAKSN